jgi:hypothetical protein
MTVSLPRLSVEQSVTLLLNHGTVEGRYKDDAQDTTRRVVCIQGEENTSNAMPTSRKI